jgi:hypothetical protein
MIIIMDIQSLILTIKENRIDHVQYLLNSINLDKWEYLLAIDTAIKEKNLKMVTLLSESKFYVKNSAPLIAASRKNCHQIISYILTKSKKGIRAAFNNACHKGKYCNIMILMKHMEPNKMTSGLEFAVWNNYVHIVDLLLKGKVIISITSIVLAIFHNFHDIFHMLANNLPSEKLLIKFSLESTGFKNYVKQFPTFEEDITLLDLAVHINCHFNVKNRLIIDYLLEQKDIISKSNISDLFVYSVKNDYPDVLEKLMSYIENIPLDIVSCSIKYKAIKCFQYLASFYQDEEFDPDDKKLLSINNICL